MKKALRSQAALISDSADAEELVSDRCQEPSSFSEDKGILSAVSELSVAGEWRIFRIFSHFEKHEKKQLLVVEGLVAERATKGQVNR